MEVDDGDDCTTLSNVFPTIKMLYLRRDRMLNFICILLNFKKRGLP